MKLSNASIRSIDNAVIVSASPLKNDGPSLERSFATVEAACEFIKSHLAEPDEIKAEREKIWHPNVIPNTVDATRRD